MTEQIYLPSNVVTDMIPPPRRGRPRSGNTFTAPPPSECPMLLKNRFLQQVGSSKFYVKIKPFIFEMVSTLHIRNMCTIV